MYSLLCRQFKLKKKDAITLCSAAADLRITQIVNGIRGCHVILPHDIWKMLQTRCQ